MSSESKKLRDDAVQPAHSRDTHREKSERRRHQDNVKIEDALNRLIDHLENSNKASEKLERAKRRREWITIILVFAAFAVSWLTFKTSREAAFSAHTDNKSANQISRETLINSQRAFIVADELHREDSRDGSARLTPVIQNEGNTPATIDGIVAITPSSELLHLPRHIFPEAYWHIQYRVGSPQDPADALDNARPDNPTSDITRNVTLGPKGVFQLGDGRGSQSVTRQMLSTMLSHTQEPHFIYGAVRYTDVFGLKHIQKYCFNIATVVHDGSPVKLGTPYRCEHWNCTDGQCEADKKAYEAEAARALAEYRQRQKAQ